ncbi:Glutathione peroxidase [Candida maltosa Xu316]|uniref:Glutathione peroxidase n=1 Tax=Candida maltosa (strain Xu316) TaxID=1245528 RepID=M3J1N5_CANMX|nr:Glutathione peroxidase [Candida maltosa Xu316]
MSKFYELCPKNAQGNPYPFDHLKNKVVLIVNVASKCKYTPQYKDLEDLKIKFSGKPFQILAFPCNQFGNEEPGTNEEIAEFCSINYGVTFPILDKVEVNGENADPVFKLLKSKTKGLFGFSRIKWNFEKFLIDKSGNVVKRYSSVVSPEAIGYKVEELIQEE